MICPNCKSRMKVTHTYVAGTAGKTQRLSCDECGMVGTAATVFVNFDPGQGEGAKAIADKISKEKTPPSLAFASEGGADKGLEQQA